jgi:hypothetical protein
MAERRSVSWKRLRRSLSAKKILKQFFINSMMAGENIVRQYGR